MAKAWWWVLAWALVIEGLVLWPKPPRVEEPFSFIGLDKLVHSAMFAVLAVLAVRARRLEGRSGWPAWVAVAAFGAFTELQQHFIPTRSMEFGDFLADSIGAAIGAAGFALLAPRRREWVR